MKDSTPLASVPSITVVVRHSHACGHKSEPFYKRCNCRKSLRYFAHGKQQMVSAKTRSWSQAEEAKRRLEDRFRGGSTAETVARTTVERAMELFLLDKGSQGIAPEVVKKYERETGRLFEFLNRRSKFFPADITLEDLTEYRRNWPRLYPSSTTRSKVQERLRSFLRYCYEAQLIERVPKLSPIRVEEPPTLPLTAEEYERLLDTIPKSFPDTVTVPASKKVKGHTRGAAVKNRAGRLRAFVQLMRWSGLAIQDAATLRRDELAYDNQKKLYRVITSRQKTGTHVSVLIQTEVAEELLKVLNGNPMYFFWTGEGVPRTAVSHLQDDFRKLFADANIPAGGNMVSHRLRDTFAVDLLEKGTPIEEVSKALGHTSIKTTERHYAKWVKGRQDRLDSFITAAWG